MKRFVSAAFLFWMTASALAGGSRDAFQSFQKGLPDDNCRVQTDSLDEFRLIFTLPAFQKFAAGGPPNFEGAFAKWSNDLLLKIALQLEQELELRCQSAFVATVINACQEAYLARLGLSTTGRRPAEIDKLFRALSVPEKDREALVKRIAGDAALKGASSDAILKAIYGALPDDLQGVLVFGEDRVRNGLRRRVREVCGSTPCPFWDSRFLRRVVLVAKPGMALYEPELGVLFLSNDLLTGDNVLNAVVVLHELAHVAERGHYLVFKTSLAESFAKISGWKKSAAGKWSLSPQELPGSRNDELTKQSAGSPFSILPDPLLTGEIVRGQRADGFAMAKSYRESLARNDPSEDYADHVAVFKYVPQRFCNEKKPFAPHKYDWVRERFFPKAPLLVCK